MTERFRKRGSQAQKLSSIMLGFDQVASKTLESILDPGLNIYD